MRTANIILTVTIISMSPIDYKPVHAGAVEGPYVIWINLSKSTETTIEDKARKYLNSGDDLCWNVSARMYMRARPIDITESLTRDGLINRSPKSQARIRSILKKPFNEATGFDGIIAFTDSPTPKLISYSLKGKIKQKLIADIHNEDAIRAALCTVMPDIERLP